MPMTDHPEALAERARIVAMLAELHEAMADVMMQRRSSRTNEERETVSHAVSVWWRVDAYLKGDAK